MSISKADSNGQGSAAGQRIDIANVLHEHALMPFGRVGRAAELLGGGTARTEFRAQLIELEAGRRFEPHQHVSIHIILVLSGRGSLTLWTAGALEPTVYPVEAGDLFCIPRNARHAMAAAEDVPLRELIINIPGLALEDEERIVWDHHHHHPHTPG